MLAPASYARPLQAMQVEGWTAWQVKGWTAWQMKVLMSAQVEVLTTVPMKPLMTMQVKILMSAQTPPLLIEGLNRPTPLRARELHARAALRVQHVKDLL
eukprot:9636705-Lingulodinium_polyedra.AAC.1